MWLLNPNDIEEPPTGPRVSVWYVYEKYLSLFVFNFVGVVLAGCAVSPRSLSARVL